MDEELKAEHAPGLEIALKAMLKHRAAKGGVHLDALALLEGMIEEARAQLPSQWGEAVEVVAWQDAENPLHTTAARRVMHEWAGNGYPIAELMTVAQHNAIVAALRQPVADEREVLRGVHTMILNALDRDAAEGKQARGEMAAELRAALSAPAAGQDVWALVEALESLMGQLPSVSCDSFHHPRKDQHGAQDECPVFERYLSALVRAKTALAAHKAGGVRE